MDQKLVLDLDQQVSDQQVTLEVRPFCLILLEKFKGDYKHEDSNTISFQLSL